MSSARPSPEAADADPRRLGPVLGFMRALWEVDHALASASKQMKRHAGISGPERLALRIIGQFPDISPGELAEILHVDPSSLTGLLKRMVHRKLVVRRADRHDARRAHLQLTPRGEDIDGMRSGTIEAGVRAALEALTPREVATTVDVLGALSRALHEVAARAGRRQSAARQPGARRPSSARPRRAAR